jgi:transposase
MGLRTTEKTSPEVEARIMQLYELDGLSYAKIAERLPVTSRTASRVVKRKLAEREAKRTATA